MNTDQARRVAGHSATGLLVASLKERLPCGPTAAIIFKREEFEFPHRVAILVRALLGWRPIQRGETFSSVRWPPINRALVA